MPGLLRFTTAGSVDDGKSTLIGRLLHDSKSIYVDQMEAIELASTRRGLETTNLALLTDGLRAEREQGITIDVAYRYFSTPRRSFIIADTPGHVQYTRNMVTGASTADLAVVLVDARRGPLEQSRRHAFLSSLLGVRHLVVAVNKMDLVGWNQATFRAVEEQFGAFASRLEIPDVTYLPISALHGDNVVERSKNSPWYIGPSLLEHLEAVDVSDDRDRQPARFPVQWVVLPADGSRHEDRGYAGRVAGGRLAVGDAVVVLPSGVQTEVMAIRTLDGDLAAAGPGQSVTVHLAHDVDVSRGDLLCAAAAPATVSQDLDAVVCWMDDRPLTVGSRYAMRHNTRSARAVVRDLDHRLDVNTLLTAEADRLDLNDIGRVRLRTTVPIAADPYAANRATGSFILINEATNATAGAGMIVNPG